MDEAADAGLVRRGEEVPRAVDHHPLELLRRPWRIATRWTTASQPSTAARSVSGRVTSPSTSSQPQRLEPLAALAPVADEAADRPAVGAQRLDDVAADEAVRARDEDHVVDSPAKFCQ